MISNLRFNISMIEKSIKTNGDVRAS